MELIKDAHALVRAVLEQQAARMIDRANGYGKKYGETFDAYWKGARDEADELAGELRAIANDPKRVAAIIARVAPAEPDIYVTDSGSAWGAKGNPELRGLPRCSPYFAGPVVAAPAPVDEARERAEFEAWATRQGFTLDYVAGSKPKEYASGLECMAFAAWQAGRAVLREGK